MRRSASSHGRRPLERAGLGGFFERSFSVEAVRRFKPAPETYRLVAREIGIGKWIKMIGGAASMPYNLHALR